MTSIPFAPAARHAVTLGIALMLGGIFLFAVNDALGKWLVASYSVGMVLLVRSAAALVVLVPLIRREPVAAFLRPPRPGLQVLRVVLSTAEVAFFYFSVIALPLADVMTFYLASPIWVAALSPFLLGEKIDRARWLAILAGFVGVLVSLNPSAATFSLSAIVAIAGSIVFAFLMLVTRHLRGTPDTVLVTYQMVGALAVGLVWGPLDWATPHLADLGLLALLGVVALGAHLMVTRSLKLAPASVVVPYQYSTIVWAVLLGYLVFGDQPTVSMIAGAAIIVASGLFLFVAEQRAARSA
ncbi:DMT family transporter [Prosthecomicrobium pneumaticum]|uniref:Drug/metabolite transporter (DMT)-like permease n=1 Tax=Prosthecomicrobium pneumaticum TaxID=81895 RepID=A0A7W9L266_9HYPH|nr:DMT family transporter [Prosthecomicrobium pneumaticum]MBB5753231.1 drug/metabolite transporter (DMT)-like permease [Prosthecomicrobium pneumaticum]